ncbi:MAG: baseplate J/gp47 family protein [Anaerolineales bacterium]|nr:baseplate J/gp47 family protein [Anaerolineales bacterium]
MKTQIITLDILDDAISVRDKMGWGQTGRILLIWPEHGQVLRRRLDLVLLQRYCASIGAQLALVTTQGDVCFHASQLGIPVFETTLQAQNERWRAGHRRKPRLRRQLPHPDLENLRLEAHPPLPAWQSKPFGRLTPFTLAVLALLALIAILLPGAQITLRPEMRPQSISLPVTASAAFQTVNLAGALPARPVSVVVEGRQALSVSGTVMLPVNASSGSALFTNLTETAITIPAGVIISTLGASPVRFATTQEAVIPAGPGRTISVPITALLPGTEGNLPPGSLIAIEGNLGLVLSVTNTASTTGGSLSPAPAATEDDRSTLYDQLFQTLRQSALEDLQAGLEASDFLLAETIEPALILEETYSPDIGQASQQLDLTLRIEFRVLAVSGKDIEALVVPVMDAALPQAFAPLPNTLVTTAKAPPVVAADGSASWVIQATRTTRADIPGSLVVNLVLGQPTQNARDRLETDLPLAAAPQIDLNPAWWPRLPFLPLRIQVTIIESNT